MNLRCFTFFTFNLLLSVTFAYDDIPTVDLSQPDEECASVLFEAATKYGFFYLTNHGVSEETTQTILEYNKRFFELSKEIKNSLNQNSSHWGYVPFQGEATDPAKQMEATLDTKEGIYFQNSRNIIINNLENTVVYSDGNNDNSDISDISDNNDNDINSNNNSDYRITNHDIAHATVNYNNNNIDNNNNAGAHVLLKQNQWPSEESLPNFKSVVENYMNEMYLLSNRLSRIVALSLNLTENYFLQPGIHDYPMDLLYLIHYPPFVSNVENGVFGTGEHSDYSLFTLLLTDHHPGLQILRTEQNNDNANNSEKEWINILDNKYNNSYIVNIADTLEIWTNYLFKSGKHRVVLNGGYDRYSIPYFVAANYNANIDCLPNTLINNKCNHKPFRSGEYLRYKLKETIVSFTDNNKFKLFHNDL